ncbi:MAG: sn-glycerol-3-phosphate ABC transporter ATP-binding protein UgpC [Halieaceae bacterium]|jgi:multiple sugar transport system ATP-binding protein|nr:sn-glycerol-3-phosphate ABC transporter ATP-binding protein UgpC [Halieaceae bacterium]
MASIELRSVVKRYPGTTAVKETSLAIADGEFFILVGPSGCGKSTLLNMIVGLDEVSGGEILVDGKVVNDLDPKERNMAMVFQSYAIYPHMTVRENMAFPLKLARLPQEEIATRVEQAAEILELGGLLERKPGALSGGQRQRVAMGRAIVRDPDVFLLDEPLSNLDAKLRTQMRTELARLQRRLGTTTVYVTHDQTEAMTLGDRIAVLRHGEIQQVGTPRQLYEHPANLFVAGFIGSPAMNFLPGRWSEGRLQLPLGAIELPPEQVGPSLPTDNPLVVGFRPEHLRPASGEGSNTGALDFTARIEVLEWMGAELFVYFDVEWSGYTGFILPQELETDSKDTGRRVMVARIDPACGLKEGDTLHLRLAAAHLQVFDAASGANLRPEIG